MLDTWGRAPHRPVVTHDVDEAVYLASRVVVMARPPRPAAGDRAGRPALAAHEQVRLSPEFAAVRNAVWRAVYHPETT